MIDEIIAELGENYNTADEEVLESILNEVTTNALFISNRSEYKPLSREIKECVKTIYLQRGVEDTKSLSRSGISSTYKDAFEQLRNDIIRNGKRVVK